MKKKKKNLFEKKKKRKENAYLEAYYSVGFMVNVVNCYHGWDSSHVISFN